MKPSHNTVLVTGGAGFIGSHVIRNLRAAGIRFVVLDNLSTGHSWALQGVKVYRSDLGKPQEIVRIFEENKIEGVVHFAGFIDVGESVRDPMKYFTNNAANTFNLLKVCAEFEVDWFVFSSTCAVYGIPDSVPISENTPIAPISPYGASKHMCERALLDLAQVSKLRYVILRYFNAAGADPSAQIGEAHNPETHLIPLAIQAALGREPGFTIFGEDYPTEDGTCVRDYVHVDDLAQVHLLSLRYLRANGDSTILNCGYGQGHSVREVVAAVKDISGKDFPVRTGPRRPGDPAVLVASNERIKKVLNWKPEFDDLQYIVQTAWNWEIRRPTIGAD